MFDVSWSEFLLVIIVAVIAIGPKQLPAVLYGAGRIIRRMQYMRFALSKQFEDFMEQNDLNEIRNFKSIRPDQSMMRTVELDEIEDEQRLAEKDHDPVKPA